MKPPNLLLTPLLVAALWCSVAAADTKNQIVILVTLDGLHWQDVLARTGEGLLNGEGLAGSDTRIAPPLSGVVGGGR